MSDEEKRTGYGVGYGAGVGTLGAYGAGVAGVGYTNDVIGAGAGTLGAYGTGYDVGCCGAGTLGAFYDFCPDDVFIQILCQLKGECVKVLTEAEEEGIICGTLVSVGRNFISVTVDGSVAYILLTRIVAVIPVS